MTAPFKNYWNLALASVDRQLVAANSACTNRGLGNRQTPPGLLEIRKLVERVPPSHFSGKGNDFLDSGHKIQPSDELFQETLRWLQEEIRDLLKHHPIDPQSSDLNTIIRVLNFDADQTRSHFGTITEGWDRLVTIKHKMLLPNDVALARSAWLVSVTADFERSLRDAICLAVASLGRMEPIRSVAAQTMDDCEIKITPKSAMQHERTDNAMAQAISEAMATGLITTHKIARSFGNHLGINDFEDDSFKGGFHAKLKDLGASSENIIHKLIELRRVILHDTSSGRGKSLNHETLKSNISPLDRWDFEMLSVVAQFLYSYSIHYTLGVMDTVSRTLGLNQKYQRVASVARYKAASELRVGTLKLLEEQLYWLAWSLADYVRKHYEDPDSDLMLRLNAAFAQSRINMPPNWKQQAAKIEVSGKATRYYLLQKCILGEWSGIGQLITKALQSGDMTVHELETWPALAPLRERPIYSATIRKFR